MIEGVHNSFAAFGWPHTGSPQELARNTYNKLFGAQAVEGHSFLLAKARDINATAAAGVSSCTPWYRSNGGARGNQGRLVDQASLARYHFHRCFLHVFLIVSSLLPVSSFVLPGGGGGDGGIVCWLVAPNTSAVASGG